MDSTTHALPATPKQIAYARSLALRNQTEGLPLLLKLRADPDAAVRAVLRAVAAAGIELPICAGVYKAAHMNEADGSIDARPLPPGTLAALASGPMRSHLGFSPSARVPT